MRKSKRNFSGAPVARKRAQHRPSTPCAVPARLQSTPSLCFAYEALERLASILAVSGIEPVDLPPLLTEICGTLPSSLHRWGQCRSSFSRGSPSRDRALAYRCRLS